MRQSVTIVDGNCVPTHRRIHRDARRAPRSGEGHDMLDWHTAGTSNITNMTRVMRSRLAFGLRGAFREQDKTSECVLPNLTLIQFVTKLCSMGQFWCQHANPAASRHRHRCPFRSKAEHHVWRQSCSVKGKTRFKSSSRRFHSTPNSLHVSTRMGCEALWGKTRLSDGATRDGHGDS